ncbi:MAG: glycosyltransferase family 4 protein [Clostridia bacterium]
MRIWLVKIGEPLPVAENSTRLLRTGMMAEKLNERKHEIVWISSTFDHFIKKQLYDKDTYVKVNDNYTLNLLHGITYKKNISIMRILNHRTIAKKFKKNSKKMAKPDLIYVSFPTIELAWEAVKYGKKNNVPVIVDIRDLWPDTFKHNLPKLVGIFSAPYIAIMNFKTKKIMKNAFAINAVSEDVLNWGLNKGDRVRKKTDRYFYIGYDKQKNEQLEFKSGIVNSIDKNKFNISFFATINNQFDYDKIIQLAQELEKKDEDIIINICGDGPQMDKLKRKSEELKNINLLGWVEKNKLQYILMNSKIGLAPYKNTFDFQMGVSNKFAEYISYGLPIMLTSEGYMKKLLEENNCGLSTQDMGQMADFIVELKNNPEKYGKMSSNAMHLYKERFVAEKIYQELVNYLEKIKEEVSL